MKLFLGQYKGFAISLVAEIVFLLFLVITSLGKSTTYVLDSSNLAVKDSAVAIGEDGNFFVTGRNDAEAYGRQIIGSEQLLLPRGVYEVEVTYQSGLYGLEQGSGNYEDITGVILLPSADCLFDFQYNPISLCDGRTKVADRVWVRSFAGVDDLEVMVYFYGQGDLSLSSIVIRELTVWRFVYILAWLLLFAVVDVMYVYFFTHKEGGNKIVVAGLSGTILFSSLPMFADFLFFGHDMWFHVNRILAIAEGIENGHFFAPIQTELLNGYGYASPLFYGQLFLYFPAILYCLAVPLQVCYQAYIFMVNAATCLLTYYCVKSLLKDKGLAIVASFIYTLSPYRMTNIYVRAALGEFTAMTFFPLVCYGFARIYTTEAKKLTWKDYLPVVIGLSGIIQSHILSCEMVFFLIILTCVIWIRRTFEWTRFVVLVKAALLTVGVNLFFLIPFVQSMQMDLEVSHAGVNDIQQHGIYFMQLFGLFMPSGGGSVKGMTDEMSMALGASVIMGMIIFLYCCTQKDKWKLETGLMLRLGVFCNGITVLCVIFSLRVFPWDLLKRISVSAAKLFCMIQFPWRYLGLATATGMFVAVIGLRLLGEHKGAVARNICCGIMVGFTFVSVSLFYVQYGNSAETVTMYGKGIMNIDTKRQVNSGEYLPANTTREELNWRRITTDEALVTVDQYSYSGGVSTFWCESRSDQEQTVELPLLNYDNYYAYALDSGEELEIRNGENNYVNIVIKPHYEGRVQVLYQIPTLWKLSYMISAVILAGIIIGVVYHSKRIPVKRLNKK